MMPILVVLMAEIITRAVRALRGRHVYTYRHLTHAQRIDEQNIIHVYTCDVLYRMILFYFLVLHIYPAHMLKRVQ